MRNKICYEAPTLEVVLLEAPDVITSSGIDLGPLGGNTGNYDSGGWT